MPLFQPSNITPSSFAGIGNGTIAVSENIKITWQVNGNVPMTAFKINIFDMQNKSVYSGDVVSINPFYPTDNKGNPQYYTYSPNVSWANWGVYDGNEYTIQIIQYWGNKTDAEHSVVQFSQSYFVTRTKPDLFIIKSNGESNFSEINSVTQTFLANYSQAQSDSINWVRWLIYQIIDGKENLLDDTGVVNTQELSYFANNMISGYEYKLVCIIQTENGINISAEKYFYVSYSLSSIDGEFEYSITDKASNLLSWDRLSKIVGDNIPGESNNDINYSGDGLVIPNGTNVYWNYKNDAPLNISPDWSMAWASKAETFSNSIKDITVNGFPNYGDNDGAISHEERDNLKISADFVKYSEKGYYIFVDCEKYNISFKKIKNNGGISTAFEISAIGEKERINDIAISPNGEWLVVVGSNFSNESNGLKNARIYKIATTGYSFAGNLPLITTGSTGEQQI